MASFLSPLIKSPDASFVLRNQRTGALVATRLEPAFERQTRNKGLLGRTGLSDGHALVIAPCNGVHTFFMKFTIDVLYLDRKHRVKKIRPEMAPWRISGCLTAHSVLELPAGTITRTGTVRGDQLEIKNLS